MAGDLEILLRGPTSKNLFQLADLTNDKKTEHLTACHKKNKAKSSSSLDD